MNEVVQKTDQPILRCFVCFAAKKTDLLKYENDFTALAFALLSEKIHNKTLNQTMKFLSNIRLLLLALWLGAAIFFSFAVAPSAFKVLPTRETAGMLVQQNLMIVNLCGLAIGLVLFVTSFISAKGENALLAWLERIFLLIVTAACAVGQFGIAWWLQIVRTEIGRPIDELALDDPLRIKFNNIHEYSVWIMVTAMIAALLAYFVISGKLFVSPAKDKKSSDLPNDFKF